MTRAQPPIDTRQRWSDLRDQVNARLWARVRRPMASRRTRRTLVAGYVLVGLVGLVLPWLVTPVWTEAAGPAGYLALLAIKMGLDVSTRRVTYLRDEVLDDLLVRLVDRFHRRAYGYLTAVALPIAFLIYIPDVDRRWLTTCAWLLICLSVGVPSALAALSFPDDDTPAPAARPATD